MRYMVTDLDGTLLRSDATLARTTLEALRTAAARGVTIGYATARSLQSSWPIVREAPWNSPVVLYNGALLYDTRRREMLDGRFLDAALAESLLNFGRRYGLTPFAFLLDDDGQERVRHEPLERAGMLAFRASRAGDPRFREETRLAARPSDRLLMFTYIGTREELERFEREAADAFGRRVHIHAMRDIYLDAWFLEFSHPEANKAEGLRLWCRHVGCDPAEVTVFGDQLNDLGLFAAAGTRVATANAHPRLLAAADAVTPGNDEDGVAVYVLRALADGTEARQA